MTAAVVLCLIALAVVNVILGALLVRRHVAVAAAHRAERTRLDALKVEVDRRLLDAVRAENELVNRVRGRLTPFERAIRAETESKSPSAPFVGATHGGVL